MVTIGFSLSEKGITNTHMEGTVVLDLIGDVTMKAWLILHELVMSKST